jgi:flagellar export protein FliJ
MKSLETLLKLAQRRLDDLGVEAAQCAEHIDDLRMREASAVAREEREAELAAGDLALAAALPAYRARVRLHLAELRLHIGEGEETLKTVREQLTLAYQEKSKLEQLLEQARAKEARRLAELEQAQLDEAAINRVGRG